MNQFVVEGYVKRKFVAPSGKFAKVVITLAHERGSSHIEFVSFNCASAIDRIDVGATVKAKGRLGVNKLVAKDKTPVMVGGYEVWVNQNVLEEIKVSGEPHVAPPPKPKPEPAEAPDFDDDTLPF